MKIENPRLLLHNSPRFEPRFEMKTELNLKRALLIRIFIAISVLLLPFGVLYWMNPLTGNLSIGNDYVTFSIDHQLALQYSLKHGSFPLYAPGFAGGGHSAAALTLGQLYHPISHIAAHLPGYWTGQALQINTVLRLVFIGLVHLALFILLRRLKLSAAAAFILSFITVYNLRMLDMFRYGASLENYLAFLLLCCALCFDYLKPARILGPGLIVLSTYLLICGGHPQIMYLGLLGAGLITCVLPFALAAILPEESPNKARLKKFYLRAGVFTGVGILVSCPYILPFYSEFVQGNASRVARNYSWSLGYSDTWAGALNSFFRPLHSDVHGAFGSSSVISLVLLIPPIALLAKRTPKAVLVLFGLCLTVFLISLGRALPLHYLFWRFVPFADAFRTPGRINLILPFLFLLLLAWWIKHGASLRFRSKRLSRIPVHTLVTGFGIVLYLVYNLWLIHLLPKPGHYTPAHINKHPFVVQQIAYWMGLLSLVLLLVTMSVQKRRIPHAIVGALLCICAAVQCGVELRYGTWVINARQKSTLQQLDNKMGANLKVPGRAGFGMESLPVKEQMEQSALVGNETARFFRTYKAVSSKEEAYAHLAAEKRGKTATAVTSRDSKQIAECPYEDPKCKVDKIRAAKSSYNLVAFDVSAQEDGLFTLSYPFFPNWRASLDGAPAQIVRADGYMLGVFVPKGDHRIEFRFTSNASFIGFICFAFAVFGTAVYFSFKSRSRIQKVVVLCIGAALGPGLFALEHRSLYVGDDLKTRYHWTSRQLPQGDNLALYKRTTMSSIKSNERHYDYYAGRAVDGDKKTASLTAPKRAKPWWQVDLGAPHNIREVLLYESGSSPLSGCMPLQIKLSSDGKTFRKGAKLSTVPAARHPARIDLGGKNARYIRLQSSASSAALGFREVEVYGD
jgi:hypothetical protein